MAYAIYYACRPNAASHESCIQLHDLNQILRFVRRAWGPLSLPIVIRAAQNLAYYRGLRYIRCVKICGVKCNVYAASSPSDEEAEGVWGENVIFYCHGGAFVADLHASDLATIRQWACKTGAVVVVPMYALAPEYPFPTGLNQLLDVYTAVIHEGFLTAGVTIPSKVVCYGDSAGGNLATALCAKLIMNSKVQGLRARLPDALMLAYPALNLSMASSPSRVIHAFDPVLPIGVMYAVMDMYPDPSQFGSREKPGLPLPHSDPLLSPYHLPDEILELFPPTTLMVGDFDPLIDDSVDFHTRLQRVGVPSQLKIARQCPHGFFGLVDLFPEAQAVADTVSMNMWTIFHASLQHEHRHSSVIHARHER
uniref:Alpha/beta hydrolase fold-3 domain-containing protein n=1 Tax=Octactis speculum TaxID=3111310 RepID=A0A7S2DMG0_9STRA